jgi:hypothetical protein
MAEPHLLIALPPCLGPLNVEMVFYPATQSPTVPRPSGVVLHLQEERGALQTVGAAGLVAFIDVYDSLEAAALQVLGQSADTTQRFIQYKCVWLVGGGRACAHAGLSAACREEGH